MITKKKLKPRKETVEEDIHETLHSLKNGNEVRYPNFKRNSSCR